MSEALKNTLMAKDFATDQDIRWCPGCGDYSVLKQVQSIMPELGRKKEDIVFISGIGCSSRFPYYMNTYGMHSIHGRATAVASGLKISRPELSVWIITGDGDALSIGGNHLIHMIRRNFNVNVLLFNNEIYGLTKGQYSPTSPEGKVTKSTPIGSLDHPFNPLKLCLGADSTFIARTMDRDPKHQREILLQGSQHVGTSMIEIYQNCNVFNDGAFELFTDKGSKLQETLFLESGKPMIFGAEREKAIALDSSTPRIVNISEANEGDLMIHDETNHFQAQVLTSFFDNPKDEGHLPRPFGVFYAEDRYRYEEAMEKQITGATERMGKGDLDKLLRGNNVWTAS
ncbi:2-oxoacid:ferredoxin oxidoreductase subunit beta [Vicingaceae bacterium]|nr:2-oxoacid:ferredoxin oxidoreductase subunit beta [Vicingaceae bacterium]MDB4060869.1 2-oxoacid:ferredoxin oxidoreductase subunit beta [Vicingaceae bacterium]